MWWIHTTFDASFAPGAKEFDLFLNQVSIKAERAEAIDFSSGYYDVAQGVVTISSIRMMQALRANGKNAALFMYPYEDHGPATKESDLDQWARWVAWLDLYVKNANAKKPTVVP